MFRASLFVHLAILVATGGKGNVSETSDQSTVLYICHVQGAYTVSVRVHSYETDSKCPTCFSFQQPGCCDDFLNTRTCTGTDRCDNTFFYCLRPKGTVEPMNTASSERCGADDRLGKLSGINIDSAPLNFSQDHVLGLPNPIPLRGSVETAWEVGHRAPLKALGAER
jgi:hypothetical protein